MLLGNLVAWWYGAGLKRRASDLLAGLARTADLLSIETLFKTLFSPFKLIDAGSAPDAAVDVQLKMWADRLFSRCFGALIRTFVIIFGLIVIILQVAATFVVLFFHIMAPLLPVFGLVMLAMGVELPWSL